MLVIKKEHIGYIKSSVENEVIILGTEYCIDDGTLMVESEHRKATGFSQAFGLFLEGPHNSHILPVSQSICLR